jgi:hypothetical protein
MDSLKDVLGRADRKGLIEDVVRLIDAEVAGKGGLTGIALKGGYAVVKKLKDGRMIHIAVDHLLDDFTGALDTLWTSFRSSGGQGTFTSFLKSHEKQACDALLAITDAKADRAEQVVIRKTYSSLRPQAEKHVKEALPGVGRLVERYM